MLYKEFVEINQKVRQANRFDSYRYNIKKISLSSNYCVIDSELTYRKETRTVSIDILVKMVLEYNGYITNPDILKSWAGFGKSLRMKEKGLTVNHKGIVQKWDDGPIDFVNIIYRKKNDWMIEISGYRGKEINSSAIPKITNIYLFFNAQNIENVKNYAKKYIDVDEWVRNKTLDLTDWTVWSMRFKSDE